MPGHPIGVKPHKNRCVRFASSRLLTQWFGLVIFCGLLVGCAAQSVPAGSASPSSIGGHQAKFVDVNGVRTRYYDVGSGEPILLIHGARPSGTSSANTWVPILTGLSKRFRVLAPDRLGHGMTENPKGDYFTSWGSPPEPTMPPG